MAKILMVDDEEAVLRSLAALLATDGHQVTSEMNGNRAIEILKSEQFDLLLTDLRMYPLDGMELMKFVRSEYPSMPVVVISAYGADNTVEKAKDLGCVAYVKKPFRIQEVLNAVKNAVADK
ncbi:MAG: response regulator [Lentisphaerae bacterium]|nr:response regulator [Lentisphaerota bacterium]